MLGAGIERYFPEKNMEKPRKVANIVETLKKGMPGQNSGDLAYRHITINKTPVIGAKSVDHRQILQNERFRNEGGMAGAATASGFLPTCSLPGALKCREKTRKTIKNLLNADKALEKAILLMRRGRSRAAARFELANDEKSPKILRKSELKVAKRADYREKGTLVNSQSRLLRRRVSDRRQCR